VPEEPQTEITQVPDPRPPRRAQRRSDADKVRAAEFTIVMRGYDRAAVDAWQEEVAQLVQRLEEAQPRDAAVKRALDEVGHETSAILQRAHESADEIAARSRSQAEGRLQRAEQEAELTVREAEERVQQLERDNRAMWEQRARLIEDMRQLADEVLNVADDALDRMEPPQDSDAGEGFTEEVEHAPDDETTVEASAADIPVPPQEDREPTGEQQERAPGARSS
jgi:DivIVA domain-containing protein